MNNLITITPINNEPRVLDTDLAVSLGLTYPSNIRSVIRKNVEELEGFGCLHAASVNPGPNGGRPFTAYYLNRQQALLVCILSRTTTARKVRAQVIEVFTAYENGDLVQREEPKLPGTYLEALKALVASEEEKLQLQHQNEAMHKELHEVTVDEWRALNHLYLSHGEKVRLGKKATQICQRRGIAIQTQGREVEIYGDKVTRFVNVYPREIIDLAAQKINLAIPKIAA
jgi:hypothetical protein